MLPLYRARMSLAANVVSVFNEKSYITPVSANQKHANLYAAEQGFNHLYKQQYNSKTGRDRIDGTNIATASMTLLFSEVTEDGDLGDALSTYTFDLSNPEASSKAIPTVTLFDHTHDYDEVRVTTQSGTQATAHKRIRNRLFIQHIQDRINNIIAERQEYNHDAVTRVQAFALNPQFVETFHHSEQGIMETLLSKRTVKLIYEQLVKQDPAVFAGFILDIHSSRPMCRNCNFGLIGQQLSMNAGFLEEFLECYNNDDLRLVFPDDENISLFTRVSAHIESNQTLHAPLYTVDSSTQAPCLLSGADRALVMQKHLNQNDPIVNQVVAEGLGRQNYSGSYFLSRNILLDKVKNSL